MTRARWTLHKIERWYHRHEDRILVSLAILALLFGCWLEAH